MLLLKNILDSYGVVTYNQKSTLDWARRLFDTQMMRATQLVESSTYQLEPCRATKHWFRKGKKSPSRVHHMAFPCGRVETCRNFQNISALDCKFKHPSPPTCLAPGARDTTLPLALGRGRAAVARRARRSVAPRVARSGLDQVSISEERVEAFLQAGRVQVRTHTCYPFTHSPASSPTRDPPEEGSTIGTLHGKTTPERREPSRPHTGRFPDTAACGWPGGSAERGAAPGIGRAALGGGRLLELQSHVTSHSETAVMSVTRDVRGLGT